jgi:hypothetical protein
LAFAAAHKLALLRTAGARSEGRTSFLKKRSKKLLTPAIRASRNARARVQTFFGSFFQKRTAFFLSEEHPCPKSTT